MDAALVLGVLGTVLSAVALGWNIYRDVMDAGRLRVDCGFGEPIGFPDDTPREVLLWTVTNVGNRTVIVKEIGGTMHGTDNRLIILRPLGHTLPHALQPGQYGMFWSDRFDTLPPADVLKSLHVKDTLGRCFRTSRESLTAVKKRLEHVQSGERGYPR